MADRPGDTNVGDILPKGLGDVGSIDLDVGDENRGFVGDVTHVISTVPVSRARDRA